MAVLHAQFQSAYARWFPPGHPFWDTFHTDWARCNEAAVDEAGLDDIDEQALQRYSAPKVSAGIIPLLAVAWQRHGGALPPDWARLFPKLRAFHQRYDDLFDWRRILDSGAVTHFNCQGRRQLRAGESMQGFRRLIPRRFPRLTFSPDLARQGRPPAPAARRRPCPASRPC